MKVILAPPADNDRSPRYMEKALAAIHQALRPGQQIQLAYSVEEGQLALTCRFPRQLREAVVGPLAANYPKARLECGEEHAPPSGNAWRAPVRLVPDLFPILRHSQFEDQLLRAYADPIDSLLQALRPDERVRCHLELTVTPVSAHLKHRARQTIELLDREFFRRHRRLAGWYARRALGCRWRSAVWLLTWLAARSPAAAHEAPLDTSTGYRHEREADLQAAADKLGSHLFAVRMWLVAVADVRCVSLARGRLEAIAGALGAFTRSRLATFTVSPVRRRPSSRLNSPFFLSHEELATLWHPPTAEVGAERMQMAPFTELAAPARLSSGREPGEVMIGQVQYRDDRRTIGLAREDRRRHVHVIGRTGVGKSTLLLNQIASDVRQGAGVGLIDPHGDLADAILRLIPRQRTNDVILFDPADREFAVAFNPLACADPSRIDQVTSGIVSAFKRLHDSWGPRLENLLRNAVFVTVEQGGTLPSLLQLLVDEGFRERIVPRVKDEIVRAFWQQEFAGWSKAYRTEAVAAITNKIQPFLTSRNLRAIVSQEGHSLNLRQIMDEGKILVVNLSKGRLGEDNSALLGTFLVTAIQQAAMTRADVPEEVRRDYYLYIDEFQNFVTSSFESILSEARKYRLNLTVSHQYLAQLDDATAAAIAGNVGSLIALAVGMDDAEWLARAMNKHPSGLQPADLTNLPKYTAYARLLVDGMPASPFSFTTLPPPEVSADRSALIRECSRRQFSRPITEVPCALA